MNHNHQGLLQQITKGDIILAVALALFSVLLAILLIRSQTAGSYVEVTVEGALYGAYSLNEDQTITISGETGENILKISNGVADMISADCVNQNCVHQNPIHNRGESIICLPHRVVITVFSKSEAEFDAISQ